MRVMKALMVAVVLLAVAFLSPVTAGEDTFAASNNIGSTLRPSADRALQFVVYGFYGDEATYDHQYKLGYENDNRTWFVYRDGDHDYQHDEGEARVATAPMPAVFVYGDVTQAVFIVAPAGFQVGVCFEDAQNGLTEGFGRGLRCNGDLDQDGEGDFAEVAQRKNPVRDDAADNPPLLP